MMPVPGRQAKKVCLSVGHGLQTVRDYRLLLKAPGSPDELGRITARAKSNLSRTLRMMKGCGFVRLERGERGRIMPKVMHHRVELDLPLARPRKAR